MILDSGPSIGDLQREEETAVFSRFSQSIDMKVRSFAHRDSPEPDILVDLEGPEKVAFELVEIVDNDIAQAISDTCALRCVFDNTILECANIGVRLSDATVVFGFIKGARLGDRKDAVRAVVEYLVRLEPNIRGPIPVPNSLGHVLSRLDIVRGEFCAPTYDEVPRAVAFSEPARSLIEGKFSKKYQTEHPIELLAYYWMQPLVPTSHWLPSVEKFIQTNLHRSPFKRVWIFDYTKGTVLFVYPDVCRTRNHSCPVRTGPSSPRPPRPQCQH